MAIAQQMKTMDEADCAAIAHSWIEGMVDKYGLRDRPPGTEITCENGVLTLWRKGYPIALAVLQRDDMNWTVLTTIDTEFKPPVEAADLPRPPWWRFW